jgi:hypothetical protein
MAKRNNHYEAAFEALLREHRLPYVAVDEKRRSLVAQSGSGLADSLKSVDFLVSPPGTESFLVDIKGRRFPSGTHHKQYWRNWSTRDDLRSLAEWARYFGDQFTPLLVFGFELAADRSPVPIEDLWYHQGRTYGYVAVPLADYWRAARTLSARWDTVSMPAADFRRHASSWRNWLGASPDCGVRNVEWSDA